NCSNVGSGRVTTNQKGARSNRAGRIENRGLREDRETGTVPICANLSDWGYAVGSDTPTQDRTTIRPPVLRCLSAAPATTPQTGVLGAAGPKGVVGVVGEWGGTLGSLASDRDWHTRIDTVGAVNPRYPCAPHIHASLPSMPPSNPRRVDATRASVNHPYADPACRHPRICDTPHRMATEPRRKLAPAEAPPPPSPDAPPTWCRGLGTHAWRIVPPMLVLAAHDIRVHLRCSRCGSGRYDRWHAKTGGITGRSYDYAEAYTDVLQDTREDVRLGLIAKGKPQPISAAVRKQLTPKTGATDGGTGTALQLVSSKKGKGRVRHRADRHQPRGPKR